MVLINSFEDYKNAQSCMQADPLLVAWDNASALFYMPITLRIEIQDSIFKRKTRADGLSRFYRWCWEHKPQICEETRQPLRAYSAQFISHILSRGAHPEKSYDPRNVNILTPAAHREWETGARKTMRIYWRNMETIELLNSEYLRTTPKKIW